MPSDAAFAHCLTALKSLGAPRVWSMLVSIFGDLAPDPDDRIDGPLLTRLTDGMDIKPEAVRVALHRLRNDNWISSVKSGRTASHALTRDALKQRNKAAPLIYAPLQELPDTWQMAILKGNDARQKSTLSETGFVPLMPRVYVANGAVQAPLGVLISEGRVVPEWVQEQIIPAELTEQFATLFRALQTVRYHLPNAGTLRPIETALLRCLIVHHWRRLVLRHPYLPPALLGMDWSGHLCRSEVVALLDQLPRPALAALAADDNRGAM